MKHGLRAGWFWAFCLAAWWACVAAAADAPTRQWTVYLLPHSHVDIGYTHVQTEVERRQWNCIEKAVELCAATADYPEGAQFKWNAEVLWALDSYLRQAPAAKRQRVLDAIHAGRMELDAFYGNELTGLCRPEELLRLMHWGIAMGRDCGATVDTAMLSDVPGCTWGLVPAMAQAGVKYLSLGPNTDHRIGRALQAWADKPFYWLAPDGRQKVLCWTPYLGYGVGPRSHFQVPADLPARLADLEKQGYPYDMVQLRWSYGDNGTPDASVCDRVRDWNASHANPKLVIATTGELFRTFEKRYGEKLPVVSGDFTPYWEDGAASSARETGLNRTAAERLVQAETLAAMLCPKAYAPKQFLEAWRNVLLYDEHTWGARQYNVTDYNVPFIVDQWKIKQAFALDGAAQSQALLAEVLAGRAKAPAANAVDVFNTSSWPRTDLVMLSKEASAAGDVVTDANGRPVPSQRLSTGALAFLAADVPGLAGKRYFVAAGKAAPQGHAKAAGVSLATPALNVRLDPKSGAIASLRTANGDVELSDMQAGLGLNQYFYVVRDQVHEPQPAGPAKITVKEPGPLVASLLVESTAPGCAKFTREIRVIDGLNRVDIDNVIDKLEVREKEGVHLGFAFNVPDGEMRVDIPWAVFRPELDQTPGACKEWLCVGRWADVSNQRYGVTWATLDAPMLEVGGITADKLARGGGPDKWLKKLPPSQTLYSYVMNNYWITNYRAFQSGPTTFRYRILPHKQYDAAASQRFGVESSQPLVATPARGPLPCAKPLVELDTQDVQIVALKPSEDHQALIVRLFGVGDQDAKVHLHWGDNQPRKVWLSNLTEEPLQAVADAIDVPAHGLATLRVQ